MKFWQKIFLWTLVLFLIICNLCIYSVVESVYRYQLSQERQVAASSMELAAAGLADDLTALDSRESMDDATLLSLMEDWNTRYEKRDTLLFLSRNGTLLENNRSPLPEALTGKKLSSSQTTLSEEQSVRYICLREPLREPFTNYSLTVLHSLSRMDRQWSSLDRRIRQISVTGSVSLMALLLLLLRTLIRPLEYLSSAVCKIADGSYESRLPVKGRDEIAQLAGDFNHMAEEICSRMEASKEESAAKQQFIDNMSHEMRTPLATVYGYAELMRQASLEEEERQEALDEIMRESKRLLKMRDELMSLSLLRDRQAPKEILSPGRILSLVVKQCAALLRDNKIQVEEDVQTETIYANPALLEILLSNLFRNAIHAITAAGSEGA